MAAPYTTKHLQLRRPAITAATSVMDCPAPLHEGSRIRRRGEKQRCEKYTMKRLAVAVVTALMMVPAPANAATVDYVVDGDTIRLRSGVYVRLIGIDTPRSRGVRLPGRKA